MKNNINNIRPIKSYYNFFENKKLILKENKNKCGIYRINNLISGKSYVGSSMYLSRRLATYFSPNCLQTYLKKTSSLIYSNLLKYNYDNFSLDILEYIDLSTIMSIKEKKVIILKREQYYIDSLNPKLNILKIAGSRLGTKHLPETKKLISVSQKNRLARLFPIEVLNLETNTSKDFANNLEAAKYLNISIHTLSRYKKDKKI
jgi:hypothetical protein